MKQKNLFLPIIILFLAVSCKNSVSEDIAGGGESIGNGTTKVVTFSLNEEQISTSQGENPMTRADGDPKTYYGINVYQQADKGKEKYAYGLFDSTNDMSLIMEEGSKYSIECVEIRDDEDAVLNKSNHLYYPFFRDHEPGEITNKFILSSTTNNDEMTNGYFSITEKDTIKFPRVYTYYGTLDNFDPSEANTVSLDMRRAVFGLRFKIEPPKDGSADLNFLNTYHILISAGDEPYDKQYIYSFHNIKKAVVEGYNGQITPGIIWTYSNGKVIKRNFKVNIARNTITTVEISFSGASPTGISLKEESSDFNSQDTSYTVGNN